MAEPTLQQILDAVNKLESRVANIEQNMTTKDDLAQLRAELVDGFNGMIEAQNTYMDAQFTAINARFELFRHRVT